MRVLILLLLFAAGFSQIERNFRYTNGKVEVGKLLYSRGEGIVWLWDNFIVYYGMEMGNMIPYMISGSIFSDNSQNGVVDIVMNCTEGSWSNTTLANLKGTIRIHGDYPKLDFHCNCVCVETKIHWTFSSNGSQVDNPYFYGKEAGLKARGLIGSSVRDFPGDSVIEYAIWGYPYFGKDCLSYLNVCKVVPSPLPGAVITDLRYCGILDNEGTKFVHPNPVKKVVTDTPLTLHKQFFPNGYVLLDCTGAVI